MFITLVITFIILTIIWILSYSYRFHTYWSRHGVFGPNLWTSLMAYKSVLSLTDYEWAQKYGRIIGFYELFRRGVIINDKDLIRDIMVKDFRNFTNRREYYFGSIFDKSIVNSHDDDWKRIRSITSPSFTTSKLKPMFGMISKIGDKFCDHIKQFAENGSAFDIVYYINAFTMDVICICNYGIEIDSIENPDHPFITNIKKAYHFDLSISAIMGFIAPKIARFFKLEGVDPNAVEFFRQITDQIVSARSDSDILSERKRTDFMQLMVDANQNILNENFDGIEPRVLNSKTMKILDREEMTASAIAFLIGGFDTTVATLSHFCYYIAKYPECQQKLYEELFKIESINDESLSKAQYLNAVINETLRLCPPGTRIDRRAAEEYRLGNTGITLPTGTLVTFSAYSVHRDPEYFEDPLDFRPERFISNSIKDFEFAFIPFGGGPRMCIGTNFALIEIRIFIAHIIKNYCLKLTYNTKIEYPKGGIILSPKQVMVIIENRNHMESKNNFKQ